MGKANFLKPDLRGDFSDTPLVFWVSKTVHETDGQCVNTFRFHLSQNGSYVFVINRSVIRPIGQHTCADCRRKGIKWRRLLYVQCKQVRSRLITNV